MSDASEATEGDDDTEAWEAWWSRIDFPLLLPLFQFVDPPSVASIQAMTDRYRKFGSTAPRLRFFQEVVESIAPSTPGPYLPHEHAVDFNESQKEYLRIALIPTRAYKPSVAMYVCYNALSYEWPLSDRDIARIEDWLKDYCPPRLLSWREEVAHYKGLKVAV